MYIVSPSCGRPTSRYILEVWKLELEKCGVYVSMLQRFDRSRQVIVITATTTRTGAAARHRLTQHPTKLGAETQHQDEVDGRVEDDEDVGDGGELLQPARILVDGGRVDGIEDKAEQRHCAADSEYKHDDERQDGSAQFSLLRRVQR